MGTRERPAERGAVLGRLLTQRLGQELRAARQQAGLSLRVVAAAAGVSHTMVWRIEHHLAPEVGVRLLAVLFAIVGMDLTARAYPGASPLRDAPQSGLLETFRLRLHVLLRWSTEVPLPIQGDQRAWDGLVSGAGWRYGVEAETGPRDSQALGRRLELKRRDGGVDGVILLLPETRRAREFLQLAGPSFATAFPVPGRRAMDRLAAGEDPGGSAIVVLRPRRQAGAASQGM